MYRMLAFCILFMMAFCFRTGVNYLPSIFSQKLNIVFNLVQIKQIANYG